MTVAMTGSHRGRFGAAMDEFRQRKGHEPDRAWRALLLLTTAAPGLWERVREYIDWERLTLCPTDVPLASYDEAALLRVAVNLLHGVGAIVWSGESGGDADAGIEQSESSGPSESIGSSDQGEAGRQVATGRQVAAGRQAGAGTQARRGFDPRVAVDVRDLADNMDGALWRVVLLAWEEYQKRR